MYKDQGRYGEAEPILLETLEIRKRVLGEEHPSTLGSMNNLANLYRRQGRYDEAEALYLESSGSEGASWAMSIRTHGLLSIA